MFYNYCRVLGYFCIALSHWATGQFVCPQRSRAIYKYGSLKINLLDFSIKDIILTRRIDYACVTDKLVSLQTTYDVTDWDDDWTCKAANDIECKDSCDSKSVSIKIECDRTFWSTRIAYTNQTIKNCDFLFWTSWSPITTCYLSQSKTYTRNCVDCDYDVVDSLHCDGNAIKTVSCLPTWSTWKDIGGCKPIKTCDSIGKQRRERKCTYKNGSLENQTDFCSNDTATSASLCVVIVTTDTISNFNSSTEEFSFGGSNNNTVLGLGIGLVLSVVIIIGLCIFIYLKRCPTSKSQLVAIQACDPSPDESAFPTLGSIILSDQPVEEEIYNNAQEHATADATYSTLNHK